MADEGGELENPLATARTSAGELASALETGDEVAAAEARSPLVESLQSTARGLTRSASIERGLGGESGATGELEALVEEADTLAAEAALGLVDAEEARALEERLADLEERLEEVASISPDVLVNPFDYEVASIFPFDLPVAAFYAPGVLALLLQHVAVSFGALSLVRERSLGTIELFRVSPLTVSQALVGKYVANLLLGVGLAGVLATGVVFVFGTPMEGAWWAFALVLLLVLLASIGLGLLLSAIARTESQAVQYTMTILLVTMFFGGFILPLDQLRPAVQVISYAVPTTYGLAALQDIIFRGGMPWITVGGLVVYVVVMFVLAWVGLRTPFQGEGRMAPATAPRPREPSEEPVLARSERAVSGDRAVLMLPSGPRR